VKTTRNISKRKIETSVNEFLDIEKKKGVNTIAYYQEFQQKAEKVKYDLVDFLIQQKLKGKTVAAYGAAAKGNTLLNYCGVKNDLIAFVCDANPHKQNKFLPASHIPIFSEEKIKESKPDFILILPWNLKTEITGQLDYIKEWDGQFVVPIPHLEII